MESWWHSKEPGGQNQKQWQPDNEDWDLRYIGACGQGGRPAGTKTPCDQSGQAGESSAEAQRLKAWKNCQDNDLDRKSWQKCGRVKETKKEIFPSLFSCSSTKLWCSIWNLYLSTSVEWMYISWLLVATVHVLQGMQKCWCLADCAVSVCIWLLLFTHIVSTSSLSSYLFYMYLNQNKTFHLVTILTHCTFPYFQFFSSVLWEQSFQTVTSVWAA